MGMHLGNGSGQEPEVMMDINTTPLIDVMLVLLIMLIITIPVQLHAVNMDMPRVASVPAPREPVVIKVEVDAANGCAGMARRWPTARSWKRACRTRPASSPSLNCTCVPMARPNTTRWWASWLAPSAMV